MPTSTPTTKAYRDAAAANRSLGDEVLNTAHQALDTTRNLASSALDKAGEKARGLGYGVRDFASRGLSAAGDVTSVAQERLGRYASTTGRYVADRPVQSILIAAAAGAVIAGLLVAARRQRRNRF